MSRACPLHDIGVLLVPHSGARAPDINVIREGLALTLAPFSLAVVPGALPRRGSRASRGGTIHATVVGRAACRHSRLHHE